MEMIRKSSGVRTLAIVLASFCVGAAAMVGASAFAADPTTTTSTTVATAADETGTTIPPLNTAPSPNCEAQPGRSINLNGCDLRGRMFNSLDLTYATFIGANLAGAEFSGSTLDHTNFSNANLSTTYFGGVSFISSNFTGSGISLANVGASRGDGKSIGLPEWTVPSSLNIEVNDVVIDLSSQFRGAGDLRAVLLGDKWTVPLVGDGFSSHPTHVINCGSGLQWGLASAYTDDSPIDNVPFMNLSDGPVTGAMSILLKDGFGRTRPVTLYVTMNYVTDFTQIGDREYLVNE